MFDEKSDVVSAVIAPATVTITNDLAIRDSPDIITNVCPEVNTDVVNGALIPGRVAPIGNITSIIVLIGFR